MATSCEELTHWQRLWRWERLGAGGEGDDRGWDGWMASLTRWTWVSVISGSLWWTGSPGVLWFMGSQRVGHDWGTEMNWTEPQEKPHSVGGRHQLQNNSTFEAYRFCPPTNWPDAALITVRFWRHSLIGQHKLCDPTTNCVWNQPHPTVMQHQLWDSWAQEQNPKNWLFPQVG